MLWIDWLARKWLFCSHITVVVVFCFSVFVSLHCLLIGVLITVRKHYTCLRITLVLYCLQIGILILSYYNTASPVWSHINATIFCFHNTVSLFPFLSLDSCCFVYISLHNCITVSVFLTFLVTLYHWCSIVLSFYFRCFWKINSVSLRDYACEESFELMIKHGFKLLAWLPHKLHP